MNEETIFLIVVIAVVAIILVIGFVLFIASVYRKVQQGRALIVSKFGSTPVVTFTGTTVLPVFHKAEYMDISVKTMEVDRRGAEGLICKDNIRADIKVTFFVRVNETAEDVLKVAKSIGTHRASDQNTIEELFAAKFSEALKTVGKRLDFEGLYAERESFRDQIIELIGKDLNGFVLEDAAIDFLEQTPMTHLDPHNILDAQGIRKITDLTAAQNVLTNDLKQNERKAVGKQNLEAEEAMMEFQRREADAKAKQQREIHTMQAREHAETLKVQAEERRKAELARIKADEELAIAEENKKRQVEVAEWGRKRVVAVEAERVEKDKQMEIIQREREVSLSDIEKEKALEVEKKAIADVVRTRIAVDKTVAEEEERIKDLRAVSEANRSKDTARIGAEAEAQEHLVKTLKAAEAQEEAAKFQARQRVLEAEAALESSDKQAKAKIRLADGVKAEAAAKGLADVMVKEANAAAIEKEGMAQARVYVEQSQAEANANEQKGMAKVRVEEAEAQVITKRGAAEASATEARFTAEAAGLAEKAKAMQELKGAAKEHEEFRIRLEADREIAMSKIEASKVLAEAQASVMGKAMENAKIQVMGGDGAFFDRFLKAVSVGQSIDGFVDNSEVAKKALAPYVDGDGNLLGDVKDVLSNPSLGPAELQNLSVSALLLRLATAAKDDGSKEGLLKLAEQAKALGIGSKPVSQI